MRRKKGKEEEGLDSVLGLIWREVSELVAAGGASGNLVGCWRHCLSMRLLG